MGSRKAEVKDTMTITNTARNPHLIHAMPGMIEASERQGQSKLVNSELLPSDMGRQRPLFERMGFKFGERVKDDPLFIHAELPPGWSKRSTDHAMWSEIVDERGVKRVGVFYKAAFYDRRADMHLVGRYDIEHPWNSPDAETCERATAKVIDRKTGNVLHEVEGQKNGEYEGQRAGYHARELAGKWCEEHLPKDQVEAWFAD